MCEHDQCRACFNSNMIVGKDGNSCSARPSKIEHNCEIMIADSKRQYCHLCKPHHVAEYLDRSSICIPVPQESRIEDCAEYTLSSQGITCAKCFQKAPSADQKSCVPLDHKIRHCQIYQLDAFGGKKFKCAKCQAKFVYDQSSEKCIPETQETSGCKLSIGSKCLLCDYEQGFFATQNYSCHRTQ